MATREEKAIETICVPIPYLHELEALKKGEEDANEESTEDKPEEK